MPKVRGKFTLPGFNKLKPKAEKLILFTATCTKCGQTVTAHYLITGNTGQRLMKGEVMLKGDMRCGNKACNAKIVGLWNAKAFTL